MYYFSGWLFHQNKSFPVKFICPDLLLSRLLVCSYLTDVLFSLSSSTSSTSLTSTSSMLLSLNSSPFITSLSLLFPYSNVTIFVWGNTFVFTLLLHNSINNIIAKWFITITATVTTYSTVISIVVIHISVLMQFILKQKKELMNKV